jgi:hypothetical protein
MSKNAQRTFSFDACRNETLRSSHGPILSTFGGERNLSGV